MIKRALQSVLRTWHRWIAPIFPPTCRFYPSCSCYGVEALEKHSLGRALWLILCRLGRCHPFHPGGYDPVPEPRPEAPRAKNDAGGLAVLDS